MAKGITKSIDKLWLKNSQADAQMQKQIALQKEALIRAETKKKIILGDILINLMKENEPLSKEVDTLLKSTLTESEYNKYFIKQLK